MFSPSAKMGLTGLIKGGKMHPKRITYELAIRGYNKTRVAKELDVTAQMVIMVINGPTESRRVKTKIAGIIGKTIEQIWGKK